MCVVIWRTRAIHALAQRPLSHCAVQASLIPAKRCRFRHGLESFSASIAEMRSCPAAIAGLGRLVPRRVMPLNPLPGHSRRWWMNLLATVADEWAVKFLAQVRLEKPSDGVTYQ
jgi:hypothetical protein